VRAVHGEQINNSFIDNSDGTITDTSTGLMWQQDSVSTITWEQALAYCNNLTLAGYNDWRLPSINELLSIVDYSTWEPPIDIQLFGDDAFNRFWSSTSFTDNPNWVWSVEFGNGGLFLNFKVLGDCDHGCEVFRAVRGGQCGAIGDSDGDTVCNDIDNCPNITNHNQIDADLDGPGDVCDNCPNKPNGPDAGTCVKIVGGVLIGTGIVCYGLEDCNEAEICDMEQGDCNSNNIGDACECYADANHDSKVNTSDLGIMKIEFFRTNCATVPCQADLNGDNKVNTSDLGIMKVQFFKTGCPMP